MIAKSLAELVIKNNRIIQKISLNASEDLICKNIFCEKLLSPCICRLERALDKFQSPLDINSIDLSNNSLNLLPLSLKKYTNVQNLNLQSNNLKDLDLDLIESLTKLEILDISQNSFESDFLESILIKFPHLRLIIKR